jgi:predicted metalloendopeptidase
VQEQVDQCSLGLPNRRYYIEQLDKGVSRAYRRLLEDTVLSLNSTSNRTYVRYQSERVLRFEAQLAQFALPSELRRNYTRVHHRMRMRDLQQLAPSIPWQQLLSELSGQSLDEHELLNVKEPNFVRQMAALLDRTDSR